MKIFLDSMVGGAWPFLVGGVICLVNSVNERDLDLLNRCVCCLAHWLNLFSPQQLLRGTIGAQPVEVRGNNRSVMPLDVLGRTRATLMHSSSCFSLLEEKYSSAERSGQSFESASCWG